MAVQTSIFDQWMVFFYEDERDDMLQCRAQSRRFAGKSPPELDLDRPPEREGSWILIGRSGQKVTRKDVIKAFQKVKDK